MLSRWNSSKANLRHLPKRMADDDGCRSPESSPTSRIAPDAQRKSFLTGSGPASADLRHRPPVRSDEPQRPGSCPLPRSPRNIPRPPDPPRPGFGRSLLATESRIGPAAEADFLQSIVDGELTMEPLTIADVARMKALMVKYANFP